MTQQSGFVRNIFLDLVLTLVTCGLFNLYVQYEQIRAMNAILQTEKYSFVKWFFFSLITCGIYHIYHEYRISDDLVKVSHGKVSSSEPLITIVLTLFGLWIVADAIQQSHINRYFGSETL